MSNDPIDEISSAIDHMTKVLSAPLLSLVASTELLARHTDPGSHHFPALVPRPDGSFSIICYACSQTSKEVVAVCELPEDDRQYHAEWPEGLLFPNVNDLAVRQLQDIRKIAAAVLMDTPSGDPRQFVAQAIIGVLETD